MSERAELEELLDPLRHEHGAGALSPEARARVLAHVQSEVRAVPQLRRARRVRRWVAVGSVFAAAASLWFARLPGAGEELHVRGELAWTGSDQIAQDVRGERAVQGDGELVVSEAGPAELTTPQGVRVQAQASTQLSVRESARRVLLRRGAVHCRVPPLGSTGSFMVDTGATQVIVHGTDFSVAMHDASAPCVEVREGRVEVRARDAASVFLGPGQSWGCTESKPAPQQAGAPSEAREADVPRPTLAPRAHRHERHRPRRVSTAAAPLPATTLEAENALLSDALHAERARDHRRAHALFEQLLRLYPNSPLVPEARAGVVRNAD